MASTGTIKTTLKGVSQKASGTTIVTTKFVSLALDFNQPVNNLYALDSNGAIWVFNTNDQMWHPLPMTRST